jgi:tetratricopeptide (TPR) repeat protein
LWGVKSLSPAILQREQRLGHWEHYEKATRLLDRNQNQKFLVDRDQRIAWLEEAISHLRQAVDARPESQDYRWLLSLALTDRARMETPHNVLYLEPAIETLQSLWEESDQRWEKPGLLLADLLLEGKEYEHSRGILVRLVAIYPDRPSAYDLLYRLEKERGREWSAIDVLELKKEESLFSQQDWENLCLLALENENFQDAQAYLLDAILLGWDTPESRFLLTVAACGARDLKTALAGLRSFLEMKPNKWPTAEELGLRAFPPSLFPVLAAACATAPTLREKL